jgi:H+/Cl- antiporter ClcA
LFVFEGLLKRFEARLVIAALAASAVAIWVGRAILGNTPEFTAPP